MAFYEPIQWSKDREQDFAHWIHNEIFNTQSDRLALERGWEDAIIQWRAEQPDEDVEFPWVGGSNIEFPLTDIHAEPVYADFIQSLSAPEDYWTIVARRPDTVEAATPLREGLSAIERAFLKMRQVNGRALLDNNILGTAVYKNHWHHSSTRIRDYNDAGEIETVLRTRSNPQVQHTPLQHFYWPADAWNVDPDAPVGGARWIAEKFYVTQNELRARANAGSPLFPSYDREGVEKVMHFLETPDDRVDRKIREKDSLEPFSHERIELYEVQARYDTQGEGVDDDVVAIFHMPSMTVLRALRNPFLHGQRMHHVTNYLPGFGLLGRGIAEIDEWAQSALTRITNATIDNALVANTRMYSAPHGTNVIPNEPIYPGKIWFTNPDEKIGEIRLGEVYPSMFQLLGTFMQWAEMRSGVSELRQGNITGLPSRTPATTILSVLREGSKRFDMVLSNFRHVHGIMGTHLLQNQAQFYRQDPMRWDRFFAQTLGQKKAMSVIQTLATTRVHDIPESFGVTVTATSALVNKEVEKQDFIGLIQIVAQVYGQLLQTAMMLQQLPPQSPAYETASAAYTAGVDLIKRLFERFDIQNISQYMGNLEAIAGTLNQNGQGAQAAMGGAPMAPPLSPFPSPQQAGGGQIDPAQLASILGIGS